MRVRFFPVGLASRKTIVVDRIPLGVSELVGDQTVRGLLTDVSGTLVLELGDSDPRVRVNGMRLGRGPVLPGDRLAIGDREFVVSYERTSTAAPVFASYLLREGSKPSVPA